MEPQSVVHEGYVVEETNSMQRLPAIVKPAVSVSDAIEAWRGYEDLKEKVLRAVDFQLIDGKSFPKKSAWRKLATFFNLSLDLVSEKEIKNDDGTIDFDVVYRATAPNGRSTIGDGSCNTEEKKKRNGDAIKNSRHNTRGTAHTRAYNRAVSNLIGGGEVSAEEIEREDFSTGSSGNPKQEGAGSTPNKGGQVEKGSAPSYRFTFGKWGPNGSENKGNTKGLSFDEILDPKQLASYIDFLKKPNSAKTKEENEKNLKWNTEKIFKPYEAWLAEKQKAQEENPPAHTDTDLSNLGF